MSERMDVFRYSDYRHFLRDYVAVEQANTRGFSIRQFCLRAGVSTQNYLTRVIVGDRNLGQKNADRFAEALKLEGLDAMYFRALVQASGAKSAKSRARAFEDLEWLRSRRRKPVASPYVDNALMRRWYVAAIWELASCKNFDLTPERAVSVLRRKVSLKQAQEAIDILCAKGLLVRKNGRFAQVDQALATTDGIPELLVRLGHKENLEAAIEALDFPMDEKGFYGLTIAISQKRVPWVKNRIRDFLAEIQGELALDPDADAVYRIQAHCFQAARITASAALE